MRWKSFVALCFLGFHFFLRILKRIFFIQSPGLKDFVDFYKKDRISTLTRKDKNLIEETSHCIGCGLCDSLCPAVGLLSRQTFLGPSFLPHLSRSIPDFAGVVPLDFDACNGCRGCESICPEHVPLKRIIEFMKSKSVE